MQTGQPDPQISGSTIAAIVALTIISITIAFASRRVFDNESVSNPAKKLLILLLLEVLVANLLGKIIFFVPANGKFICGMKGFAQLFSDISGLTFYSAAQIISFVPVMMPKNMQKYFKRKCKKFLNLKLHLILWCIDFLWTLIPSIFDSFGHDGHRCYVKSYYILLFVYQGWVYVIGTIFLLCSFCVIGIIFYNLCYKKDQAFKKVLCKSFT
eukprot:493666_1